MTDVRQRESVRHTRREQQPRDMDDEVQQTQRQMQGKAQDLQHQAERLLDQGSLKAHQLANNLQANPKMATGLLVLTAFCLGIALSSLAARSGLMGGSKFHDPQSRQAHEALDVMLGHVHGLKGSANEKMQDVKDGVWNKLGPKGQAAANAAQDAVNNNNLGERLSDGYHHLMGHADAVKEQAKLQAEAVNARLNGAGATTSLGERMVDGLGNLKDRVMGTHEPTMAEKAQGYLNDGVQGLRDAVKPHEPTLSEKLSAGVAGVKAKLSPHEPTLLEKAQDQLNNLRDAVKPHEPTLSEKLSNGYQNLKDSLKPHEPTMAEKVQAQAQALKDKVTGTAPTTNTVQGKLNEASLKAKEMLHNAADAVKNNIPGMGGAADAVKAHVH